MIIAVDTGGTKTLISSFDKNGKMGERFKFPTPKDPFRYVVELREKLEEMFGGQKVESIIVAIPGIIKDGVAVWCNNLGWKNFNVKKELTGVLGNSPVFIENDANLAGLAETRILKKIPDQALYVTISTGIGTGIITHGKLNYALKNSEGGRALVEFDGRVQEWENFASGKAIVRVYKKYARDITSPRIWKQIAERISRGFLVVIPILQPDIIIIGGSIGTYFERYGKYLESILKTKLPPHINCPLIKQAKNPELAVVYGCYYYALDQKDAPKS